MPENRNIVMRFYVKHWEPVWEFVEKNIQACIVRQQARRIRPGGHDEPYFWQVILVLDDKDAARRLVQWLESNARCLQYELRWDKLLAESRSIFS